MQKIRALLLLATLAQICTGADWCYQSQVTCESHCKGPRKWEEESSTCGGRKQSPINIVTRKTIPDERLTPFQFSGYQQAFRSSIKNNGHSVAVNIPHMATISGGNLETTYKAVQFHLHWGRNGGPGSEHTIDGEQYPMELHIVHMKQKFSSLSEALQDPTGVAVLGFFYEVSKLPNNKYGQLIKILESVPTKNASATFSSPLSLNQLIPREQNLTGYYRYEGSLTTPGCNEAVVWTVFQDPIPLDRNQLSAFSRLKFHDGTSMVDTFRPVQPLNDRTVYRSGSAVVLASLALLLASISLTFGLSHAN
ncbi:carbonic anhydrase 4a [Denticeps clupeoides]|uniref:Carbonic anhydrase n=1 Tax=Denticeps clupeoides TaxID=299321 RepID=A0AAY4EPP9_9TELE|nr:carbonic anhydrase 4-like [Denticeps clupeoides]